MSENKNNVTQGQRGTLLPLLLQGLDIGLQTPAGLASWLAAHGTSEKECEAGLQLLQQYGCAVNLGETWKATLTPGYIDRHPPAQVINDADRILKMHGRNFATTVMMLISNAVPDIGDAIEELEGDDYALLHGIIAENLAGFARLMFPKMNAEFLNDLPEKLTG